MKDKLAPLTDKMRERIFVNGRIDWVNMSDTNLNEWAAWAAEHHEQNFSDPRQRSYFRVNKANMQAESIWRAGGIPF